MNHELAKTLTTALVQFIDRERPEGSMCCSNTDCANLENAFNSENFAYIEAYIKMKLLGGLTEFEKALRQIIEVTLSDEIPNGSGGTMSWAVALSDDDIKKLAPKVLAITREQLIKDGYVIEKKAFYDAVEKVSPEVMKEVSDNVDNMEEELTEFEQVFSNYLKNDFEYFHTKKWDEQKWNDVIRTQSKELLALAKKELLSYADESNPAIEAMADLERTYFCNPDKLPKWLKDDIARKELNAHTKGYNKGYKDAEKQYNESVAYHFPIMPTPPASYGCDGVHCTNPQMDCINCPHRFSSGRTITAPNTASGTSTLKAEG